MPYDASYYTRESEHWRLPLIGPSQVTVGIAADLLSFLEILPRLHP